VVLGRCRGACPKNSQAQWVFALCVSLPVEMIRLVSVTKLMLHENGTMVLPFLSVISYILVAIYSLAPGEHQDDQTSLWRSCIMCAALLNGFLCFIGVVSYHSTYKRNPGANPEAQVEPSNPWATPTFAELVNRTRLARLTLQTFTMETHGIETEQTRECAICLNCPCPGEVVTELHCHHVFHSSCITCWIDKGGRGCPMRCQSPSVEAAV